MSTGITRLKEYNINSHIGRGERYGKPVELDHQYAIALTVEMEEYFLDRAPHGPTIMESAQQYLNSGAIAVQLAEFIREFALKMDDFFYGRKPAAAPDPEWINPA